jgi:4-nitrophenyl phosphatase
LVGLDFDLSYDRLTRAANAVRLGARFIATNTDPTYPVADGLLPGGGAMVAAVRVATGVEPEIAGKPHSPMRALLRAKGIGEAWVIGDRVDTDIAMARAEPDWTSILVLTGVTDPHEPHDADFVVPDLTAAVDLVLASSNR